MHSIYHFFADLTAKRARLAESIVLEDFPFDERLLSCRNTGVFPDLAIKVNRDRSVFTGGELVELKSSNSYSVSSFNSTIPTGEKNIVKVLKGETSNIRTQMREAGDDIESLPVRQVYYLVRGRKKMRGAERCKVCLVHGSFFETIPASTLVSSSFEQAMSERLAELGEELPDDVRRKLLLLFSEQETFSRTRSVQKASVRLRFRVMTEVMAQGNILNTTQYPQILDDSLNFVVPSHDAAEAQAHLDRLEEAFMQSGHSEVFSQLAFSTLKHHLNGDFLVAQIGLMQNQFTKSEGTHQ